ncbi:hypothetical protein QTI45_32890 [Variovorax sp. J22R187]|nr:hypothetical protein [Variovorax sp. J22R187]
MDRLVAADHSVPDKQREHAVLLVVTVEEGVAMSDPFLAQMLPARLLGLGGLPQRSRTLLGIKTEGNAPQKQASKVFGLSSIELWYWSPNQTLRVQVRLSSRRGRPT